MKKSILIFLTILESLVGVGLLIFFYNKFDLRRKTLGVESIAVIDKELVSYPSIEYKYYYQFEPNKVVTEKPDWLPAEVTYTYNGDGLNDRFDYPRYKEKNVYRIVALGDSFTYGHFVNTAESWPEQLEEKFKTEKSGCYDKVEVINLGMPGFDIPYIVKRYQEVGAKYDPDLIVWFESGSGFARFNEIMAPLIKECENQLENNSQSKKEDYYSCWHRAEKQVTEDYSKEYLNSLLTTSIHDFYQASSDKKVIFTSFNNYQNNELLVSWQQSFPDIKFVASVPELTKEEILPDGHPNTIGQEKIMTAIYDQLISSKISECN